MQDMTLLQGNPAMNRLLLVDDDVELAEMLRDYLVQEGFAVTLAHDGETGAQEALSGQYALIVLDVMMPRASGVEVLGRVRAHISTPIIMLTAKGAEEERIAGLDLGADEFRVLGAVEVADFARLQAGHVWQRDAVVAEDALDLLDIDRHGGEPFVGCGSRRMRRPCAG